VDIVSNFKSIHRLTFIDDYPIFSGSKVTNRLRKRVSMTKVVEKVTQILYTSYAECVRS